MSVSSAELTQSSINHFLLRIGDGNHFRNSSSKSIWGITSKYSFAKGFISRVKEGDKLWFVQSNSKGKIVAMATFTEIKNRIIGPLVSLTETNEELGWTETYGEWDIEVHYKDLYDLSSCELYSEIKGPGSIYSYSEKCKINLPNEYLHIVRYLKTVTNM